MIAGAGVVAFGLSIAAPDYERTAIVNRRGLIDTVHNNSVKLSAVSRNGGGTGFYVESSKGVVIITNAHVCLADTNWTVSDGTTDIGRASVIKSELKADLCAMTAPNKPSFLPELGSDPSLYSHTFTIGYPYVRDITVQSGYTLLRRFAPIMFADVPEAQCKALSGESQTLFTMYGFVPFCRLKQDTYYTNMITHPGQSGSPVYNARGYIVGVIQSYDPNTHNGQFIPVSILKDFIKGL